MEQKKTEYVIRTTDKGMAIRLYRTLRKMTVQDMGKELNFSGQTVCNFENGKYKDNPTKQKYFDEIFQSYLDEMIEDEQ